MCFTPSGLARKNAPGVFVVFQMSVEKRSIALEQARPSGLREKFRHALL
jgi:hypothetical protein